MKKIKIFYIIACFLAGAFFADAAEAAIGISPGAVENDILLRGSDLVETITLSRSEVAEPLNMNLSFEGDALKDWIIIDKAGKFTIPVGVYSVPVNLHIKVPADAKLGKYEGTIIISGMKETPPGEQRTGSTIQLGVRAKISLTVTDKKIARFTSPQITVAKTETESLLKFNVNVVNTGNVPVKPSKMIVNVSAFRDDTVLETHEITEFENVAPFTNKTIAVLSKEKTKLSPGVYNMTVTLYDGAKEIRVSRMTLELYGKGETNLGAFQSFRIENEKVSVGDKVRVAATFKNVGKENVNARFSLKVYTKNGDFVGNVESERTTITPNNMSDFVVMFNANRAGGYLLKGVVEYDGKQTEEQVLELKVSYPLYVKMSLVAVILIIVAIVTLVIMKKSSR